MAIVMFEYIRPEYIRPVLSWYRLQYNQLI